jgi:hypothetical protein
MTEELAKYVTNVFPAEKLTPKPGAGDLVIVETTGVFEFEERLAAECGKAVPNVSAIGGMFFGSKNLIVLSDKPYSNVPARDMGLTEAEWKAKSLVLRREHENTHYYTKRFFGSARNNLHDEIIADFFGIYAAFGEYKGEYFLRFIRNRMGVYAAGLSPADVAVLEDIAAKAAEFLEAWSRSPAFGSMSKEDRIDFLCRKDLLSYVL